MRTSARLASMLLVSVSSSGRAWARASRCSYAASGGGGGQVRGQPRHAVGGGFQPHRPAGLRLGLAALWRRWGRGVGPARGRPAPDRRGWPSRRCPAPARCSTRPAVRRWRCPGRRGRGDRPGRAAGRSTVRAAGGVQDGGGVQHALHRGDGQAAGGQGEQQLGVAVGECVGLGDAPARRPPGDPGRAGDLVHRVARTGHARRGDRRAPGGAGPARRPADTPGRSPTGSTAPTGPPRPRSPHPTTATAPAAATEDSAASAASVRSASSASTTANAGSAPSGSPAGRRSHRLEPAHGVQQRSQLDVQLQVEVGGPRGPPVWSLVAVLVQSQEACQSSPVRSPGAANGSGSINL